MRAVLRRVNRQLGTNWTLHDLRHTAAIRMASDPKMPLVSLQTLLGHAYLTTTQQYLTPHLDQIVAHVRQHHRDRSAPPPAPPEGPSLSYDDADMKILFGWQGQPGATS
jgi:integrase